MRIRTIIFLVFPSSLVKAAGDGVCENDPKFTLGNVRKKGCYSWFRDKEYRRQNICANDSEVREKCKKTCGLCCGDDVRFKFKLDGQDKRKHCAWLMKGNKATRDKKRRKYCGKKSGGIFVSEACAKACMSCMPEVPQKAVPSLSPTKSIHSSVNCVDNSQYRIDNDNDRTCDWLAHTIVDDVQIYDEHCAREVVSQNCPQTCRKTCCEDSKTFKWKGNAGKTLTCSWILKRGELRKEAICVHSEIKTKCPDSCGLCDSFTKPQATQSPTTAKAPISWPSLKPTEAPTSRSTSEPPSKSPTAAEPTNLTVVSKKPSSDTLGSTTYHTSPPTTIPTPATTASPTSAPTTSPTSTPTSAPTSSPSSAPTMGHTTTTPTPVPTVAPTTSPTTTPISTPTTGLIMTPTTTPTPAPTASPTVAPTISPTATPTPASTASPTMAPTKTPALVPTASPIMAPTTGPTTAPTPAPTASPTAAPTVAPTTTPTTAPTTSSTVAPTTGPTTEKPTRAPEVSSTVAPTTGPTTSPTPIPTASPTVARTTGPSTTTPTQVSQASPTATVTINPTVAPTSRPIVTKSPTVSPIQEPSVGLTMRPTAKPICEVIATLSFDDISEYHGYSYYHNDDLSVQKLGEMDACSLQLLDTEYCSYIKFDGEAYDGGIVNDDYYYLDQEEIVIQEAAGFSFNINVTHRSTDYELETSYYDHEMPGELTIKVNGVDSGKKWTHDVDADIDTHVLAQDYYSYEVNQRYDHQLTVKMECSDQCVCSFEKTN